MKEYSNNNNNNKLKSNKKQEKNAIERLGNVLEFKFSYLFFFCRLLFAVYLHELHLYLYLCIILQLSERVSRSHLLLFQ